MTAFSIALPPELVEAAAERAAELLAARLAESQPDSPWLDTRAAAEYLCWPVQRVYKHVDELPHFRHGQRLMFRRDELDRWLERYRERGCV